MNRRHLLKLLVAAPLAGLLKPVLPKPAMQAVDNPDWLVTQFRTHYVCTTYVIQQWQQTVYPDGVAPNGTDVPFVE